MRRRWAVVGLAVLVLALGIAANVTEARLLPYGPTSVSASLGQDVQVSPFRLHVTGAQAATTVTDPGLFGDATTIDSDGVWVVVDLSYATVDTIRSPAAGGILVRDPSGRAYPVSNRSPATEWLAGADTWVGGQLAFEVAPDALAGLVLEFAPSSTLYGPMPNTYALIPLDLDGTLVDNVELVDAEPLAVGER